MAKWVHLFCSSPIRMWMRETWDDGSRVQTAGSQAKQMSNHLKAGDFRWVSWEASDLLGVTQLAVDGRGQKPRLKPVHCVEGWPYSVYTHMYIWHVLTHAQKCARHLSNKWECFVCCLVICMSPSTECQNWKRFPDLCLKTQDCFAGHDIGKLLFLPQCFSLARWDEWTCLLINMKINYISAMFFEFLK